MCFSFYGNYLSGTDSNFPCNDLRIYVDEKLNQFENDVFFSNIKDTGNQFV